MKAYEFPAKVTPEGTLELPDTLLRQLPSNQEVRVIVLITEQNEQTDVKEEDAWSRFTAEQFLAGYSAADAIYDQI